MEMEFASQSMTYLPGKVTNNSLHRKFFKSRNIFQSTSNLRKKKREQDDVIPGNFYQKNDRSHLTMESFTIQLVSIASAQLFPDNTLNSFEVFLPEQQDL